MPENIVQVQVPSPVPASAHVAVQAVVPPLRESGWGWQLAWR